MSNNIEIFVQGFHIFMLRYNVATLNDFKNL